jgi:hypothetical protein
MRLEPELWNALEEICHRERTTLAGLLSRLAVPVGGRTSAVRVAILLYYRAAVTEAGHLAAGHGGLLRQADGGRPGQPTPVLRPGASRRRAEVAAAYSGGQAQPIAP